MDHNEAFQTSFSSSGSRKEKKKQVKDEVDRLRQAEKKKRRLEKALATSAAIRSELEKKKQKKKEEQQRLDEEVAAIAEAVALHVLADEDSEETTKVVLKKNENIGLWQGPYFGLLPENLMVSDGNIEFYLGRQRKDALYQNSPHCYGDGSYYIGSESRGSFSGPSGTEWEHINWKLPHGREIERTNGYPELNGREFVFENGWSRWKNFCLVNQKRMACDAKARAAEVSAGLAAAQAVAALRIAEEARAEAEAANIVAETAITRILDKIT